MPITDADNKSIFDKIEELQEKRREIEDKLSKVRECEFRLRSIYQESKTDNFTGEAVVIKKDVIDQATGRVMETKRREELKTLYFADADICLTL